MTTEELIEHLADAEHDSWSRWTAYLLSTCTVTAGGHMVIPAHLAEGWQRQSETSYADLTEREKESDRAEVRLILPAIEAYAKATATPASS